VAAPLPLSSSPGLKEATEIKPVIDLHTHLFNSRYIPLAAWFTVVTNMSVDNVNKAQALLHGLTGESDFSDESEKMEISEDDGDDDEDYDDLPHPYTEKDLNNMDKKYSTRNAVLGYIR
jgi:hypothetical protein